MMKRHRTLKIQHMTCAPKDADKALTIAALISRKNTSYLKIMNSQPLSSLSDPAWNAFLAIAEPHGFPGGDATSIKRTQKHKAFISSGDATQRTFCA
jgi:hypothetical protein